MSASSRKGRGMTMLIEGQSVAAEGASNKPDEDGESVRTLHFGDFVAFYSMDELGFVATNLSTYEIGRDAEELNRRCTAVV